MRIRPGGSALALLAALVATGTVGVSGSNPEGEAFLKENAGKEGVVVLPSGLQYKVLKSGAEDARKPRVNSPCKVCARGDCVPLSRSSALPLSRSLALPLSRSPLSRSPALPVFQNLEVQQR